MTFYGQWACPWLSLANELAHDFLDKPVLTILNSLSLLKSFFPHLWPTFKLHKMTYWLNLLVVWSLHPPLVHWFLLVPAFQISVQTSHGHLDFSPSLLRTTVYSWRRYLTFHILIISSVQFSHSVMSDSVTPWTAACQASLSITSSRSLLKLMSIKLVMPSNHLIFCHPLLLLPSIFPSIRVFSKESVLAKILEFQFQHESFLNEHSGLISFRMDWLNLLDVQGTLKSLLQYHSSKASILWRSAFFIVQLSQSIHDYWKNHSFD